jgi:hypothetical protein
MYLLIALAALVPLATVGSAAAVCAVSWAEARKVQRSDGELLSTPR